MNTDDLPHSVSHSSLELFDKLSVLDPILWSNVQEVLCKSSPDEEYVEFFFQSDYNNFIDMQDIYLKLAVTFFDRTSDTTGSDLDEMGSSSTTSLVIPVNNMMHSLFSNVELYMNGTPVYTSNGLYGHKAFISNEISHTAGMKNSLLKCQGYEFDSNPSDGSDRALYHGQKRNFFGKLCVDAFTCDQYLLPGVNCRLRLTRADNDFITFVLPDTKTNTQFSAVITDIRLFVRKIAVHSSSLNYIEGMLARGHTARYNYSEIMPKTYVVPNGQNEFTQEDVFNRAPIRRLVLAMNTNSAFRGSKFANPFHYQKFNLSNIKIIRGSQTIVDMKTEDDTEPYVTTLKALKFDDDGPGIDVSSFSDHYILAFDLTSTQEANVQMFFPEVLAAPLRLELYFSEPIFSPLEILILGERLSTITVDRHRAVEKNG